MMDATVSLLTAIRAALLADPAIAGSGAEVLDTFAPPGAPGAYLTMLTRDEDWSTSDTVGQTIGVEIHVWTTPGASTVPDIPDTSLCRTLIAAARRALHHVPLTLTGAHLVLIRVTGSTGPTLDPDGATLHGVITTSSLTGN